MRQTVSLSQKSRLLTLWLTALISGSGIIPGNKNGNRGFGMKRKAVIFTVAFVVAVTAAIAVFPSALGAVDIPDTASPAFPLNLLEQFGGDEGGTTTVQIMLLLTVLSIAPSILIMVTAFTRIVIVLSFIRNAMGTQQMPPNQVIVGLSLFLAFFVMYPVFTDIKTNAYDPYEAGEITITEAYNGAMDPLRDYMYNQIVAQGNESDLRTFIGISSMTEMPQTLSDIPTHVLIPAYITSEIKTAFKIGFLIFLPFIVIDMVVASTLMAMGMMMLPPVMISLPFKVMLFVLVDGWNLTITNLIQTFRI